MEFLFELLVWVVFIVSSLLVVSHFLRKMYKLDFDCDERHFAKADDGVFLAMYRLKPDEIKHKRPVILCHGMGSNRYNLHLKPGFSLAEHLKNEGFDCWLVELRGHGESDWPENGYDFDDMARLDLPAFIKRIQELTGQEEVLYVGHSMGGMLLYAYLGSNENVPIKAAVAVGSPAKLGNHWGIKLSKILKPFKRITISFYFSFMIPFMSLLKHHKAELNPENVDNRLSRQMTANAVSRESRELLLQFVDWMKNRSFTSNDGIDYLENAKNVSIPLFLMAGSKDKLVPRHQVRAFYDKTPEEYRHWRDCGSEGGMLRDYGHVDMLMGYGAAEEVFPAISEWLLEYGCDK